MSSEEEHPTTEVPSQDQPPEDTTTQVEDPTPETQENHTEDNAVDPSPVGVLDEATTDSVQEQPEQEVASKEEEATLAEEEPSSEEESEDDTPALATSSPKEEFHGVPPPPEEPSEEDNDKRDDSEPPSRIVAALENLQADGDLRKPLEELIEQTLAENPIYETREALLNEEDPHALIFWGKTISAHAKRMKSHFLRKRKDKTDEESFQWSSNQIVMVYINFHASSIDKFLLASVLDPSKSFNEVQPAALASLSSSRSRKDKSRFPTMQLCYEWGLASLRYGKALENQQDCHAAYAQFDNAAKLFMRVMQEDRRRKWTGKVLNKIVMIFEGLARVKPSSSDVRIYCDLFLVQFSNIAMRGEMKDLSLKPLIAMVLTNSRHIRDANAIDVVRHLATFFESDVAEEASKQLAHLEEILNKHANKEVLIERLPNLARKRLERSGLKREEYLENIEVLVNILQWQGKPTCRLSHNYTKFGEDVSDQWKKEDPREYYTNKSRITAKESRNGYIYIAKRKTDKVPVTIKVMTKWAENQKQIKKEVALLGYMNQHEGFTKLLDVYLHNNEVWAIVEYCDAGNMVDFIPVAVMSEAEIAYVVKELLQSLSFLHRNKRMHRDLTTDDILLNMCGDVLLADFEMWMGASTQRFWLSPELLLAEPYPYGPEVDIWSLGCIIMEMADGYPPYSDLHPIKEFFYTATRGAPPLARPNKWSKEFRWFLESCLHPDPTKRATADRLLGNRWLNKACTRNQFSDIVRERVSWTRW